VFKCKPTHLPAGSWFFRALPELIIECNA